MRTAQQRNGLRKGLSIFLTLCMIANDLSNCAYWEQVKAELKAMS